MLNNCILSKKWDSLKIWNSSFQVIKMTSNYRHSYGGVEMNDYFRAVLSSQQEKSRCKARKFSQNTERGEKGRGRGVGEGKEEWKKGRISAVVWTQTAISWLYPLSGRQPRGAVGKTRSWRQLCFALAPTAQHEGTQRAPRQGEKDTAGRPTPSLASSCPPFAAYPLGTSLDEQRQSLPFSSVHQQISDKTDFQENNIDLLTLRCFNLQCSCFPTAHLLVCSGIRTPMSTALGSATWHVLGSALGTAMQGCLTHGWGLLELCFPVRETEIEETLKILF